MRLAIFSSFLLFTAVVIAALWIFQTVFLESLYKSVRFSETEKCAEELIKTSSAEFSSRADALSDKYDVCISVYEISQNRGVQIAQSHSGSACFIHNVASDSLLDELYKRASDGGEYTEKLPRSPIGDPANQTDDGESIIYVRLAPEGEDDTQYMFLINTEVYPLSSTVSTLKLQLVYVSAALVAVAAVLSVIMANMVSRPAVKMSREASKLAMGNYDVSFDGGVYLEMKQLAGTLNHASQELSGLDRMQKELIANVSHDLRTPLTLISGYSEVMRDIPGEMTGENMQIIIDETARLSSLVNDMLDISRLMAGDSRLNVTRFSLTDTVRETLERYARLREREGYVIDFEYDREVFVEADKVRLLQVIYNLVNNAINYTGEDRRVQIRQSVDGSYVRLEVTDSGEGIPKEELPMIWERYYKSSSHHKRAPLGSGLGLSIVKNILALHKAKFGVKSRVGHGSTFWFELPVV